MGLDALSQPSVIVDEMWKVADCSGRKNQRFQVSKAPEPACLASSRCFGPEPFDEISDAIFDLGSRIIVE